MAKASSSSAFDEILGTFTSPEDRDAFSNLTERNPWLKDYGLRQADYSRKQNELQGDLEELNRWRGWREENWDAEAKVTKSEAELQRQLAAERAEKARLAEEVALGGFGGDMNFSDLEGDLEKYLTTRGVVTKDVLDAKEKDFRTAQGAMTTAALHVPFLNQKHFNEFGELFDPDEFLQNAVKAGQYDLKNYYEKDFVVGKREAARKAAHDAEIARVKAESETAIAQAKAEAAAELERLKGMGPQGAPTDTEGPSMGHLQRSYLKMSEKPTENDAPPEVPIGEGGIAAFAAQRFRAGKMAGQ